MSLPESCERNLDPLVVSVGDLYISVLGTPIFDTFQLDAGSPNKRAVYIGQGVSDILTCRALAHYDGIYLGDS